MVPLNREERCRYEETRCRVRSRARHGYDDIGGRRASVRSSEVFQDQGSGELQSASAARRVPDQLQRSARRSSGMLRGGESEVLLRAGGEDRRDVRRQDEAATRASQHDRATLAVRPALLQDQMPQSGNHPARRARSVRFAHHLRIRSAVALCADDQARRSADDVCSVSISPVRRRLSEDDRYLQTEERRNAGVRLYPDRSVVRSVCTAVQRRLSECGTNVRRDGRRQVLLQRRRGALRAIECAAVWRVLPEQSHVPRGHNRQVQVYGRSVRIGRYGNLRRGVSDRAPVRVRRRYWTVRLQLTITGA